MNWVRTWRLRRREQANLFAALLATEDELAHCQARRAATWAEFTKAKEVGQRRNELLREQDGALRSLRTQNAAQAAEITALRGHVSTLATSSGSGCTKLLWHNEGEARVFGEWLEEVTDCGALEPYECRQCRRVIITGARPWHVRHVDRSQRRLADATHTKLGDHISPEMLRAFRERFAAESEAWATDARR